MFIPQFEDLGVYKNDCFLSSRDCLRSLSYPWISLEGRHVVTAPYVGVEPTGLLTHAGEHE